MKELLMIGVAVLAAIATVVALVRRSGGDCLPWLLLYGSAGAGLVTYLVLKTLL